MGSTKKPATLLAPTSQSNSQFSHLTKEQQTRIQEDLVDRERQAAALASAGMVAESVNYAKPSTSIGQVLQAPPPLVGMAPPTNITPTAPLPPAASPAPTSTNNNDIAMEAINWNMGDLGNPDAMDMDFAAMFDPEQEQAFMDVTTPSQPSQESPPHTPTTTSTGIPNPLAS
jgi:hypothetical protein